MSAAPGLAKLLRSLNSAFFFSDQVALLLSPKLTSHNLPDLPSDVTLPVLFSAQSLPCDSASSWLHRIPSGFRFQGPLLCVALDNCLAFLSPLCFALSLVSISSQRSLGLSLKHRWAILGPDMEETNGRGLFFS